jgi:hypothetical protein
VDKAAARAARAITEATGTSSGDVIIEEVANAERSNYKRSVVRYEPKSPGTKRMAEFLSAAIPGSRVVKADIRFGIDAEVIVGKRFTTKRIVRIDPIPLPKPGKLPDVCQNDL